MKKKLLNLLQKNPRMSDQTLAKILGVSTKKITEIIKQLLDSEEIVGFVTVMNSNQKSDEVHAIVEVRINITRGRGFNETAERIARFPEVENIYLISGNHDLNVFVRGKSLQEVSKFVHQKLATLENIRSTNTHFLLKKYKEDGLIFDKKINSKRLKVSA
jgi:DNA-binding Lrp family transcriptional regulator